jgi:hypothetical protein
MDRQLRGIDSLSPAQFAGMTLGVSLFAFVCGGIVEAQTLSHALFAPAPAVLEPVAPAPDQADPAGAASPPQPVIFEDRNDSKDAPAEAPPVEQIDGGVATNPEPAPDAGVGVVDGATAAQPAAQPDPSVAVTDAERAPAPQVSSWSAVPVFYGEAPLRSASVEVIDGSKNSFALGTVAPVAQWRIVSGIEVIDGSAPFVPARNVDVVDSTTNS